MGDGRHAGSGPTPTCRSGSRRSGAVVLALVLTVLPQLGVNLLGAVLIMVFGFFFVVVSSRITGEIGVSANPISGMTIAALIGTAAIFLLIGWTGVDHRVGALSIAGVIAVAAGNAGATSQDLKTGFLVGATPRRQQIAIMVGAVTSALAIGWTLTLLNNTYTNVVPERHPGVTLQAAAAPGAGDRSVTDAGRADAARRAGVGVVRVNLPTEGVQPGKYLLDPATNEVAYLVDPGIGGRVREIDGQPITKLDSPKATIMALVTDGILTQKLPWGLVLIGVFLTIAIELMGLQSLPIAVGVYLPDLDLGRDVRRRDDPLAGGAAAQARRARLIAEVESGPGVLFSSGLIAGGAIAGISIAGIAAALVARGRRRRRCRPRTIWRTWSGFRSGSAGFASSDLVAARHVRAARLRALPRRETLMAAGGPGLARDQRQDHPRGAGAGRDDVLAGGLVHGDEDLDAGLRAARAAGAVPRALPGERGASSGPRCSRAGRLTRAGAGYLAGRLVASQPRAGDRGLGPGRGPRAAGYGRLSADPRFPRADRHACRAAVLRELPAEPVAEG